MSPPREGKEAFITPHTTKNTRRQTTWNSRFRLESAVWVGIREFRLMEDGNRGKQLEITKQRGIHGKAAEFSQQAWNSACILEFGVFLKTPFRRPRRFPTRHRAGARRVAARGAPPPPQAREGARENARGARRDGRHPKRRPRASQEHAESPRRAEPRRAACVARPRARRTASCSCASRRRRGTGARWRRGLASPRRAQGRTNDRREQNNSHTKPRGVPARLRRREPPDRTLRNEIARVGPSGERALDWQ